MDRIGVFGGTFDPPHWGHVQLAEAAHRQLHLDVVLWVPAAQPPHKQQRERARADDESGQDDALTAAHHRAEMIRLAIADHPQFLLSRLDLDRPGPQFTADLCALLRDQYGPETAFWFIIGEDSLRELPTWHTPDRVVALCRLAVFPRQGPPVDWDELQTIIPHIRERVDWLQGQQIEISSTDIRSRARRGESIRDLVPPAVWNYIQQHKLYQEGDSGR
jgi:nicotinate-nucleotide adenylyltransferase